MTPPKAVKSSSTLSMSSLVKAVTSNVRLMDLSSIWGPLYASVNLMSSRLSCISTVFWMISTLTFFGNTQLMDRVTVFQFSIFHW